MISLVKNFVSPLWHASTYRLLIWLTIGGVYGSGFLLFPPLLEKLGVTPVIAWIPATAVLVAPAFVRQWRDYERRWANKVLGIAVRQPVLEAGAPRRLRQRVRMSATDLVAGRAVLWSVFRALFGLLSFAVLGLVIISVALALVAPYVNDAPRATGSWTAVGARIIVFIPLTLALLVVVIHFARLVAHFLEAMAAPLLGAAPSEQINALLVDNNLLVERSMLSGQRDALASHLHDSIGQTMTVIMLQAARAHRKLSSDPEFVSQALSEIEKSSRQVLKGLDHALSILRGHAYAEQIEFFNPDAREEFFEAVRILGVSVSVSGFEYLADVPSPLRGEAWRIIREGCINVLRHASSAPVQVRVTKSKENLEIVVENDPPETTLSPDATSEGRRGQLYIAKRVHALGGTFHAGPMLDGGYQLQASLPLRTSRR